MNLQKFLLVRDAVVAALTVMDDDPPSELLIVPSSEVNVPVYVDGSLMDVSKKVPYKSIDVDYDVFDTDFMIKQAPQAITTHRGDLLNFISNFDINTLKS